jgi:hypothetical protein
MLSAKVAPVAIGFHSIQGLMDENGSFYVAMPQLADIKLIPQNKSAKQLEPILGIDSSSHITKLKTPIHSKAVNAISIVLLEEILFNLSLKGNEKAIELSRSLIGLSLHKLFSVAFKQKCDDEDLQNYLKMRQQSKRTRRTLTDSVDDWHKKNTGEKAPHLLYAIATNKIYVALWGMNAEGLERHLGCVRYKSRSVMDEDSLHLLELAEANVRDCIDYDGTNPIAAVDCARLRKAKRLPTNRLEIVAT